MPRVRPVAISMNRPMLAGWTGCNAGDWVVSEAWRSMTLHERERAYSPSSCVPSIDPFIAAYATRSREALDRIGCRRNLAWGPGPEERLDLFPAPQSDAPLLVFIHGGYWQLLSKNESLFAAPDCVAHGIAYAAIDYTLAPRATLAEIVDQCRRAIAWLWREAGRLGIDRRRIFIAGSSAGAHLAAMLLVGGWHAAHGVPDDLIAGAVLLSGVFDVEPLIGTYINDAVRLRQDDVAPLSPQRLECGPPLPTIIAWGEAETGEFKRQSRTFAAKLAAAGFPAKTLEAPGRNHFDIVFDLTAGDTPLGGACLAMIEKGSR